MQECGFQRQDGLRVPCPCQGRLGVGLQVAVWWGREKREMLCESKANSLPCTWLVTPELANLASHLRILTAPCSGTNGFQELPVSCNHLGSGLSLHLYKHLHPLLLTCGLLYSAAKLVNSCNQIAALLTACMKVNNTSIFQCPASSLMTLLTVLVGSLSDITNSGTAKTIVSVLAQATRLSWAEGGCAGRQLPTDCPCAPVPCAIVITFHGLMAG